MSESVVPCLQDICRDGAEYGRELETVTAAAACDNQTLAVGVCRHE